MPRSFRIFSLCLLLACLGVTLSQGLWRTSARVEEAGTPSPAYASLQEGDRTKYHMDLRVDTATMKASLQHRVEFTNTTGMALGEIALQIYANAYSDAETPPFSEYDMASAYPLGWGAGGLNLSKVTWNGADARFQTNPNNPLILQIFPDTPLEDGERVTLECRGVLSIPPASAPFGYSRNTLQLSEFYPVLCEFREGNWYGQPHTMLPDLTGDALADYTLRVSLPERAIAALPGAAARSVEEGRAVYTTSLNAARDIALSASEYYHVLSRRVGEKTVYVYCLSRISGEQALDYAAEALAACAEMLGEYPYGDLIIAEVDSVVDSRVYPGLLHLSSAYFTREALADMEMYIARGVALQWTAQMLGVDYRQEPWLATAPAMEAVMQGYYKKKGEAAVDAVEGSYLQASEWLGAGDSLPLSSHLYDYPSKGAYDAVAWVRGYRAMEDLRDLMGDEAFYAALREYCDRHAFQAVTSEDFLAVFAKWDASIDGYLRQLLEE